MSFDYKHKMAKRSDFAQKLLDDLRLRKERLAASQSSNRANPTAADAYAYAKRNYRGSRGLKTTETTGFGTRTAQNSSSGGNKSFNSRETAKQIVPFGRGQRSEQIGDLSRALAFALENGGGLKRMDSSGSATMLAFLNQLGRGSMDYTKMERRNIMDRRRPSTSNFPTISHVHIEEISRGAQKLNQILRACSNGLNFDRYSIEVGKELLKGAIDLGESLRMLVNLQEASDYMVSPKRKNRIILLDEDEDEDDNTVKMAEQKQLDRPRFSFDRPSRNYHDIQDVAKNDLKLRLAALSYSSEATNFIYGKQSAQHKRSASSGSNVKYFPAFSEQKNYPSSSQSKLENGRIPNVIAKLMGLDEFPDNVDSKDTQNKDSGSKHRVEAKNLKSTTHGSTKNTKRTEDTENLAPQTAKQKAIQTKKIQPVHKNVPLNAERVLAAPNASFHAVTHDAKPPWKELEDKKPVTGSEKASIKVVKQQSSTAHSNGNIRILKNIQEKPREQKGEEKSKMKEPVKDELQLMAPQTHKRSEFADMSPEKTWSKEDMFRTEDIYTNKVLPVAQDKSQNSLGVQQPHRLQKSEPKEEKHQAEERKQRNTKQKLETRKQKGTEPIVSALSKQMHYETDLQKKQSHTNQAAANKKDFTKAIGAMPTERILIDRHHEDNVSNRSSSNLNTNIKASVSRNSNLDRLPSDLEPKIAKPKAAIPPPMGRKPVREPENMKAESIKLHKREIPRKINEVLIKRSGTLQNSAKSLRQQHSILQVKQRSDKLSGPNEANQILATRMKSRETELSIIKSNITVPSIRASAVAEKLQKEAEKASILCRPNEEENQSLSDSHCPQAIAILMNDRRGEEPTAFNGDEVLKSHIIESNSLDGTREGSTDISDNLQLEYHKISKSKTPEPLSESENHFKQILIKSQVFIHTAEALFKLNIPFGILHAGDHHCQDEDSKLTLDCGYEIMKRKGRRQELSVHPFVHVSITATKARSLDELVKELHKDFDTLKFYGRNGKAEVGVEDYLPKMLESDLYNKDPDVNCMWDLSWNEMMFAFIEKDDVVRDVERCVLNGLLDDITRDLYYFQVQAF